MLSSGVRGPRMGFIAATPDSEDGRRERGCGAQRAAAQLTPRLLAKAERRVLEEELTVHLSVPGDTILINNRPSPREPPPYQEPRPRGNPAHPAPSVPSGSGKTSSLRVCPSSPLFSRCAPFPSPCFYVAPSSNSFSPFGVSITAHSSRPGPYLTISLRSHPRPQRPPVPVSTRPPSLLCSLIVSSCPSSLLDSPRSFHPPTIRHPPPTRMHTSFIHSSRTCHSLHPPSHLCITHPPVQSSIIQPSISPSIHAASPLSIHSLSSRLASTLRIWVLSSLSVHRSCPIPGHLVCLALSLTPSPCPPPLLLPTALLLSNPAYRLLLATYARPPRGPGPPTPAWAKPTNTQGKPLCPGLRQAPRAFTGTGKGPHTSHRPRLTGLCSRVPAASLVP